MAGLWGDDFEVPSSKEVAKKVIAKTKSSGKEKTDEQKLRSRVIDPHEKLEVIKQKVYQKLGTYANNTIVIYDKDEFAKYIDKAIENGVIAIDTETNNTLDTTTCKIMGLCIYTDGQKQAYIPINHVNVDTGEKLSNQLTEEDVKEQLSRLGDTKIIMHNAPFDYQVIGYTCDIWLKFYWDTFVGAKLLDENKKASLKELYTSLIDPSIEKYNINSFFESVKYAIVDPTVFSLYAATDAFMTYKLYKYQLELMNLPENKELLGLMLDVEMPVELITANMERTGVCIDTEYADRLMESYRKRSEVVEKEIAEEVGKLSQQVLEWRLTPEANLKPKKLKATKDGNEFGKSKNEQLPDPINVASNTQLAILMYDVLKLPVVNKEKPRSTDSDALKEHVKHGFSLGKSILKKREIDKIVSTYVDAIPKQVSPRDNRLHAKFNSVGTDTGRMSSSDPNL